MLNSRIIPIASRLIRQFSVYDLFLLPGNPTFKTNTIILDAYPFKPSQMYPSGEISFSNIKAIYCNQLYNPPSLLLKEKNELIFFSHEYSNKLLEFGIYIIK